MRSFYKWVYRLGLRRDYHRVDRIRYLKRLAQGKHPDDQGYFAGRDLEQFRQDSEVAIRAAYRDCEVVFACDPRNHFERLIIRQGFEGHPVLDCMSQLAPARSLILDVGANVGVYSVPLAAVRPDTTVHAFEPNPLVARRLATNVAMNRLANVVVHPEALSDAPGEADFYRLDADATLSSLNRHAAVIHGVPDVHRVKVQTVDAFFADDPQPVGFIKVDVQGAERKVLEGAQRCLRRDRPVLLIEHEDSHFESPALAATEKAALSTLLADHGYAAYCLSRHDARLMFPVDWGRALHGDVLALPA